MMGEEEEDVVAEGVVEVGYRMRILTGELPVLVRQVQARGLSFQLWPAATALCWYLEERCANTGNGVWEVVGDREEGQGRCRVVELGAGTGMVGIMAARMGAQVVSTDLEHVLPNLEQNVKLNEGAVQEAGGSVAARKLRWGVKEDVEALEGSFHLVLASDVVYYDTLFEPLMQTILWLVEAPGARPAVVILAHLRRWKKDARFFKMAAKHFHVQAVHTHPSPEGARLGVVVYSFRKR